MSNIKWEKYSLLANHPQASAWLRFQESRGLALNTVQAYAYALEDYLRFCDRQDIYAENVTREHIARYIRDEGQRPIKGNIKRFGHSRVGLSNATQRQRLSAIRLFYDYLEEEGLRDTNPVIKGSFRSKRGLVPAYHKLPWIPNDSEWRTLLEVARSESIRNRFMLALAYDAGLRREELCLLETRDIDPSRRLISIRAETTKNSRARVVPYSEATSILYVAYLRHRRQLGGKRGLLFLSESRNAAILGNLLASGLGLRSFEQSPNVLNWKSSLPILYATYV